MVRSYSAEHLESEGSDGLFRAYTDMIRRSARLLSGLGTGHIAIEPMNEPQHGYDLISRWQWQEMMKRFTMRSAPSRLT